MYRLTLLLVFLYVLGCDSQEPASATSDIIIDTSVEPPDKDPYTLQEAGVENNNLVLNIFYSGGCAQHEFILYASDSWLPSTPPGKIVTLVHDANGDTCEAAFFEELTFNLTELQHPDSDEILILVQPFQSDTTFASLVYQY